MHFASLCFEWDFIGMLVSGNDFPGDLKNVIYNEVLYNNSRFYYFGGQF